MRPLDFLRGFWPRGEYIDRRRIFALNLTIKSGKLGYATIFWEGLYIFKRDFSTIGERDLFAQRVNKKGSSINKENGVYIGG